MAEPQKELNRFDKTLIKAEKITDKVKRRDSFLYFLLPSLGLQAYFIIRSVDRLSNSTPDHIRQGAFFFALAIALPPAFALGWSVMADIDTAFDWMKKKRKL